MSLFLSVCLTTEAQPAPRQDPLTAVRSSTHSSALCVRAKSPDPPSRCPCRALAVPARRRACADAFARVQYRPVLQSRECLLDFDNHVIPDVLGGVEIRSLWGPRHLLQDCVFSLWLMVVLHDSGFVGRPAVQPMWNSFTVKYTVWGISTYF